MTETLHNVASAAKARASSAFDQKRNDVVGDVDNLAQALRRAGQEMSGSPVSKLADTIADQLETVSRVAGDRDLSQLGRDVEQFARRNPVLFLGGAALAGFLAARFLKSTEPQPERAPQIDSPLDIPMTIEGGGTYA